MRLGHEGAVHSQSTLQPLEQRRSAFFYMPKNGRRKSLVKHTKRNKQKWRIWKIAIDFCGLEMFFFSNFVYSHCGLVVIRIQGVIDPTRYLKYASFNGINRSSW